MSGLKLYTANRSFRGEQIDDPAQETRDQILASKIKVRNGDRIAITAGSRGIADIDRVIKAVAETLTEMGAAPFIIPAMGSHGGGTAEGQVEILESYGITPELMGVPVMSSMEVVEIPAPGLENSVFMDRYAWESDGVIVVNRVKAHTDFHGAVESGVCKMAVIGLGKHRQATEIHSFGLHGIRDLIGPTADHVFSTGKVVLGIGLVENARDQLMAIRAMLPADIRTQEAELLRLSKANMPYLPSDRIDILIIDRMGKDISGVGMDPNIIGRYKMPGQKEPEKPEVHSIVVCGLTDGSHGNAIGVGLADVITRTLFDGIDYAATFENLYTSTFLERGKIPLIADSAETAFDVALRSCALRGSREPRVVRIQDTLSLGRFMVSEPIMSEIESASDIEITGGPVSLFTESGDLVSWR